MDTRSCPGEGGGEGMGAERTYCHLMVYSCFFWNGFHSDASQFTHEKIVEVWNWGSEYWLNSREEVSSLKNFKSC